ncbi:MAG TPA: hypothetical protein VF183_01480 [Acidimicrobiales bacterium]
MNALRRAAQRAAKEGELTAAARPVRLLELPDNVTSLDEVRARRNARAADAAG